MSNFIRRPTILLVFVMAILWALPAGADLISQVDTFDTDTEGWGGGASPTHVATGGPAGAGDGYLEVSRTFAFHIATKNSAQWAGDYAVAGRTAISLDANHISGPDPLALRILLLGNGGTWASTTVTPATAGWNNYTFGITPADLVYVSSHTTDQPNSTGGTGILADTMASVNALQIRHDGAIPTPPGNHPPHVIGVLGLDNIRAVPEPGTLALVLSALGVLITYRGWVDGTR